jgi:hypothetical protein
MITIVGYLALWVMTLLAVVAARSLHGGDAVAITLPCGSLVMQWTAVTMRRCRRVR